MIVPSSREGPASDEAGRFPQGDGRARGGGSRDARANPFGGVIYVFRSTLADRVKLTALDGTGLVLATKRLEQGWPSREGVMRLTLVNSSRCWRLRRAGAAGANTHADAAWFRD